MRSNFANAVGEGILYGGAASPGPESQIVSGFTNETNSARGCSNCSYSDGSVSTATRGATSAPDHERDIQPLVRRSLAHTAVPARADAGVTQRVPHTFRRRVRVRSRLHGLARARAGRARQGRARGTPGMPSRAAPRDPIARADRGRFERYYI